MDWWQIALIILVSIIAGLLVGYLLSYLIITQLLKKPFVRKRETATVVEEPLKSTVPNLLTELIKKRETTEQLTKQQAKREAEEVRRAREIEKQAGKEAELQAKQQAKREAEEVRKTREAEKQAGKEAELQAKEQARREPEEAKRAREAEKQERKEAAVVEEPQEPIVPELVAEVENNHRIATKPWTGELLPFQTGVWDTSPDKVHILPANLREALTETYTDMRLANSIVWLSTELGRRTHNLDENYMKLRTNIAERLDRIKPLLEQLGE